VSIALNEDQAPYNVRPIEPTEENVTALFQSALEAAREVPGGMGYLALILKMHLNPDTIRKTK